MMMVHGDDSQADCSGSTSSITPSIVGETDLSTDDPAADVPSADDGLGNM